jgi:hypothetical protein
LFFLPPFRQVAERGLHFFLGGIFLSESEGRTILSAVIRKAGSHLLIHDRPKRELSPLIPAIAQEE